LDAREFLGAFWLQIFSVFIFGEASEAAVLSVIGKGFKQIRKCSLG
jgi:hypothetical protein